MTRSLHGKVVAITGAGSGIGRALAHGAARRGARLALADWDPDGLAETADQLTSAEVITVTTDVSEAQSVAEFAARTVTRYGMVHQIYNNAGVAGMNRLIGEQSYAETARVLGVNLWGVIHGTTEFLPHLIRSGDGHVINLSSLNGFLAQPRMSAYVASKFAVRGYTETLRTEMLRFGHPVQVTVVHPGGVKTGIGRHESPTGSQPAPSGDAQSARDAERLQVYRDKLFTMTAEDAAERILRAVERGKPRVMLAQARGYDPFVRLFPSRYQKSAADWDRRTFGE
ncbi:MAG: SDR family NAD(P)-dependent oxidoreductase [Microbacterium sp.]|jgi:NAD(P)-dependent dehydrogenase (short-subunit alcohol dehydrogenase family)|nr:SDR family NAD(P)-dependent oxidoreductase [Microbacterium sp.]